MRISELTQSLYLLEVEYPDKTPEIAKNFYRYLIKKGLKRKLPLIMEKLDKIALSQGNFLELEVTSAKPLSDKDREKIKKQFYPKQVITKENVDHSLIGGIIFKINETTYDGSIKSNLGRLKEALWQIP